MESPRKLENQRWRDRGVHVVLRIAAEQNSGSTLAIVTTQPFLGPTARFERLLKRAAQFVNSSTPNSVTREIGEKSGTAAAGTMSRTAQAEKRLGTDVPGPTTQTPQMDGIVSDRATIGPVRRVG